MNDWLAAAKLWRGHTPEELDHRPRPQWRCRACGSAWACEWWLLADRVLAAIFMASCRPLSQSPGAVHRPYRRRSL
ncbi:MAG: hypothetical protein GEU94_06165 [Micromonosporaceae bacterium]|nr:hypothetical protein [Micromonosporaceae bacterium]